ncbi:MULTISPECIES: hypothetical protein [unclassified Streptomyces]|uniref:hypothetical protein n=1 Tax=unclassified Streptomyces TaxID=2593676 RepID=UPI0016611CC0|nr:MULTISPECIES: hypothetical protein [unclassified Streptomyces]MBD0708397.1 hypothetical protein [Streptomyces sp. CBMA291]MBD0714846.1 hypothetical protein [Streptomyces sp. CBMA370]
MPQTGYIYVPAPSGKHLEIGLDAGLWGWRTSALDRADSRQIIRNLVQGDFLVFGHRGPNSRVAPGGWADAALQRVIVAQITRPLFEATNYVWPGDTYPERIGFDVLSEEENVTGPSLGADAMEALRLSANKQGTAVVFQGSGTLVNLAAEPLSTQDGSGLGDVSHDGDTSAVAQVLVRREQQKLRRALIGARATLTCAFCGRTLPSRLIRAAHIKRRSEASRQERLNLNNVLPACLMGCDELFEHGYIYVGADGTVAASPHSSATSDLRRIADGIAGRTVSDFAHRADFFRWHRERTAGISA